MKKFVSVLCAGTLSLAIGLLPAISPTVAAPLRAVPQIDGVSDVQTVQHRREHRRPRYKKRYRKHQSRSSHWRGYRGERHKRHGYRRHSDGLWYPLAAFGLGAIIGGAIANQPAPSRRSLTQAHIQWCYDRYRSYRASDNTFQPYNGPRTQCRSPY